MSDRLSDEQLAEWLAYEGDLALHAAVMPSQLRSLLTELQHSRAAQAVITDALRNEIIGIFVTNTIGGTDDFPSINLAGVIGDLSELSASPASPSPDRGEGE